MGLVVFLAVVGALTIYAFHILFDASVWGFIVALVLFILGVNASDRPHTDEHKRVGSLPVRDRAGTERLLAIKNPTAARAASMAMVIGIGLGWLLRGMGNEALSGAAFLRVQNQRVLAIAPLKAVLETVPSATPAPLGGKDAQFQAKMTFRNESGNYCRQYELVLSAHERMAGIACRIPGGDWSVMLQSLLPRSASNLTVPASAGRNAALDAAIGALIDGDPLVGEAEATIMSSGWQK
jgi:surface antigen